MTTHAMIAQQGQEPVDNNKSRIDHLVATVQRLDAEVNSLKKEVQRLASLANR